MNLVRSSWLRVAGMLALVVGISLATAAPAAAHNGNGGDSSDYEISITGYSADPTGVELQVIELGDRVELRRTTASEVVVLGYEGEQYLRLDAEGVWQNTNSPAYYLNADRFAAEQPPASVTPESPPAWERVSTGDTARWHDHRAHYMSLTPPDSVQADPDTAQLVHSDRIAMLIDGRAVAADVSVSWLPKPERMNWMIAASLLGALVTAALVLSAGARRSLPFLAIGAALAAMLGQGQAVAQLVIGGTLVAVAVLGALIRRPLVSTVAALASGTLAALRLEVFEHELLAGWIPGVWQRVVVVVALALGFGIAASALVTALSPTPPAVAGPHAEAQAEVTRGR